MRLTLFGRLAGHRERLTLGDDLPGESRARGSRELDRRVTTEHRRVARNEDRLEITGARHDQIAAPTSFALHPHLVASAELVEVRRSRDAANGFDETRA